MNLFSPTAKWGLPFILEWSELYELRPGLYEPLFGAGWLQETSDRPVKLRVVRLVTWGWMQLQRYNIAAMNDEIVIGNEIFCSSDYRAIGFKMSIDR